jgi:ADP-heptose:LPS heptosyltransferase
VRHTSVDGHGPQPGLDGQAVHKVIVVRAHRGLGDQLCLVPALRALRQALPYAEVTLCGLAETRWMLDRFPPYVDKYVEFPGYPPVAEKPDDEGHLPPFLAWAREESFDLAIQAHGSGVATNPFVALLGARMVLAHALPGQFRPDPSLTRDWVPHEPEPLRYLRLLDHAGIPPAGDQLEFPVTDADRAAAARLLPGDATGAYACVHPGTHHATRRWSPARFAEVADRLVDEGLRVVLTGGPGEGDVADAIAAAMRRPQLSVVGRTDLGALAALLEGARLLVCGDTGVSHLAAALRVPSVVVFRCSDPERWAPLDRTRHRPVGLADKVVAEQRTLPAWHCCMGEACQLGARDDADVPSSTVTAADVMAEVHALVGRRELGRPVGGDGRAVARALQRDGLSP